MPLKCKDHPSIHIEGRREMAIEASNRPTRLGDRVLWWALHALADEWNETEVDFEVAHAYFRIRAEICERNYKLVFYKLKSFESKFDIADDVCSGLHLALLRAVESYNPWLGIRFSTYAMNVMFKAVCGIAGRGNKRNIRQPTIIDRSKCLWGEYPPPDEVLSQTEVSLVVRKAVDSLPERYRQVVNLRYPMDGARRLGLREVGRVIGTTRQRVQQIEAKAMGMMRKTLEMAGIYGAE
jgi:RNA polymerase sigma factor (sigma-70 family)